MTYSFFCPCTPPKATAQQKGVAFGGKRPIFYTKKKVRSTQEFYYALFFEHRPPCPFDGALRVTVVITFPWRKGERKAVRALGWVPMPVRPDFDNLSKTPFDTLSKLSFWCDDGQVFDGCVIKGWGNMPGVRVTIETVDGETFAHLIGAGTETMEGER